MKAYHRERMKALLTEAVTGVCKTGLQCRNNLTIDGLLGITVDEDIFLVPIHENVGAYAPDTGDNWKRSSSGFLKASTDKTGVTDHTLSPVPQTLSINSEGQNEEYIIVDSSKQYNLIPVITNVCGPYVDSYNTGTLEAHLNHSKEGGQSTERVDSSQPGANDEATTTCVYPSRSWNAVNGTISDIVACTADDSNRFQVHSKQDDSMEGQAESAVIIGDGESPNNWAVTENPLHSEKTEIKPPNEGTRLRKNEMKSEGSVVKLELVETEVVVPNEDENDSQKVDHPNEVSRQGSAESLGNFSTESHKGVEASCAVMGSRVMSVIDKDWMSYQQTCPSKNTDEMEIRTVHQSINYSKVKRQKDKSARTIGDYIDQICMAASQLESEENGERTSDAKGNVSSEDFNLREKSRSGGQYEDRSSWEEVFEENDEQKVQSRDPATDLAAPEARGRIEKGHRHSSHDETGERLGLTASRKCTTCSSSTEKNGKNLSKDCTNVKLPIVQESPILLHGARDVIPRSENISTRQESFESDSLRYPERDKLENCAHFSEEPLTGKHDKKDRHVPGQKSCTCMPCKFCNKCFQLQSHLERHLRIHTGEKPFVCDYCGKAFSRPHVLKRHLRAHTGEKPYVCKECGVSFHRTEKLQRHLYTHTGERPFACQLCPKSFGRKDHLQIHIKTHSKIKKMRGRSMKKVRTSDKNS